MSALKFILPFFVIASLELLGHLLGVEEINRVTKPLLMPALIFYFVKRVPVTPLNRFIILALFLSFLGDTLLMLVPRSEYFFIAGLGSFLIAHIVYIIINMNAISHGDRGLKPQWQDLIFVAFGLGVFSLINNDLGSMYAPVLIYTVVICLMAVTARQRWKKVDDYSFKLVMIGSVLFLISDSLLALDKFYKPFGSADFLVMLTYIAAQFLIVQGLIGFIEKATTED